MAEAFLKRAALRPVLEPADEEAWRPVVGFPGYEISDHGSLRRAGRPIKWGRDTAGYPAVCLYRDGCRFGRKVHRLVAESFIGPKPTPKHEIAHGDGNKRNPHVSNLRWATRAENIADRLLHGAHNRGERHGLSKLTTDAIQRARERRRSGEYVKDIARDLGVAYGTLRKALRGESWAWLRECADG
jgi:hypothetical protein